MIGKNWQLITNEPVEFEKWPVEVEDCRKITDNLRGIYRIYPNLIRKTGAMIGKNRQLVTNEPVEFEEWPVEVQDLRKITDPFRGIYRIYPNLVKENQRMPTCNQPVGLANTRISTGGYAQKPISPITDKNHDMDSNEDDSLVTEECQSI